VTTLANGSTINYVYDDASQLSSITYQKADTTVIGDLSYTYDDAGRRTKTSGSLAAADLPSTVSSPGYNANNQLTSWAGSTYTYDSNGNLTSDGSITYTWDARNQLASLSSGATASFSYDGRGRRIGKTIGGTTTAYVYDRMNFVQEKDGTGGSANVTANLITGLMLDDTYARMTGSNPSAVISHFLPDANSNVIKLLDSTQAITDSYSYEAYGTTTHGTGTNGNSQQYTGRENDGTGLYFYRARYYLPAAGRFVAEDPIGIVGGINFYAYVEGNPISFKDPLGQQAFPGAGFVLKQILRQVIRTGAGKLGQEPLERGAEREKEDLLEMAWQDYKRCQESCRQQFPTDCDCEQDCRDRYYRHGKQIDADFPNK
jgi:RHS repeat-associated protein